MYPFRMRAGCDIWRCNCAGAVAAVPEAPSIVPRTFMTSPMASRTRQTTRASRTRSAADGAKEPRSKKGAATKEGPRKQDTKKQGSKKQSAAKQKPVEKAAPVPEEPLIPEHVARFLAELPMRGTPTEFQRDFCLAIKRLAGDIDIIACEMAMAPNLSNPRTRLDGWSQHVYYLDPKTKLPIAMTIEQLDDETALQRLISRVPRILPEEIVDYHEPPGFEYWHYGDYLGAIALVRSARKSPVSQRTVDSLSRLGDFFEYCITSFCMRQAIVKVMHDRAVAAVRLINNECKLDYRENEIVIQRFLGYNARRIAVHAGVSEAAIKKRLARIYKRAGVRNFFELLWPYIQQDLAEQNARAAELKATEPENGIYFKF